MTLLDRDGAERRHLRLQPHTVLKDAKTKQKLEAALRDLTTLTLNTTISIEAMDGLQLKILELKPNKHALDSVRIVDTDLVVEFEAALDGSSGDDAHFDRPLLLDNDDADDKDDTISDAVAMGALRFYKVKLLHRVENVRVAVTPDEQHAKHDLDLCLVQGRARDAVHVVRGEHLARRHRKAAALPRLVAAQHLRRRAGLRHRRSYRVTRASCVPTATA